MSAANVAHQRRLRERYEGKPDSIVIDERRVQETRSGMQEPHGEKLRMMVRGQVRREVRGAEHQDIDTPMSITFHSLALYA